MRVGQGMWIEATGAPCEVAGFESGHVQVYIANRNEVTNVLPGELLSSRPTVRRSTTRF